MWVKHSLTRISRDLKKEVTIDNICLSGRRSTSLQCLSARIHLGQSIEKKTSRKLLNVVNVTSLRNRESICVLQLLEIISRSTMMRDVKLIYCLWTLLRPGQQIQIMISKYSFPGIVSFKLMIRDQDLDKCETQIECLCSLNCV